MFLEAVPPPEKRMQLSDSFLFSCHKDLACFNSCCRSKHLPLTPYDVLRLKKALNLHSDDFLTRYAVYRVDRDSGFPTISLKMREDSSALCPFVSPEGCGVYDDRPTACRLYPLGRAGGRAAGRLGWEAFFYMLDTPDCLGIEEKRDWKIKDWQDGQGLFPYIKMNDGMLDILFHTKRDRKKPLDERQVRKVMVACYNLDVFREFVFKTEFLELFEVDQTTRSKIEEDVVALLNLGLAYLRNTLF